MVIIKEPYREDDPHAEKSVSLPLYLWTCLRIHAFLFLPFPETCFPLQDIIGALLPPLFAVHDPLSSSFEIMRVPGMELLPVFAGLFRVFVDGFSFSGNIPSSRYGSV